MLLPWCHGAARVTLTESWHQRTYPGTQVTEPTAFSARGRRLWCDLALDVAGWRWTGDESVVGVDTSPAALRALSWAADQTRLGLASRQVAHP
jgi:hypothetical protein